jgi:CBS domain-containing protein
MGDKRVNKFSDPLEKRAFTRHLLQDIKALERMLDERMFESGIQRIGAEQEMGLLDEDWNPSFNNVDILNTVKDEHFTTEIARFNLEINLDPLTFKGDCFSKMESDLVKLLNKGKKAAGKHNTKLMITGIMPTLRQRDLSFEHMTPNPRYEALNDVIRAQRGEDINLRISGLDDLITTHPNILFEACNTSFQVHLQIEPDDFVQQYNWAQAIAGPVLSVVANSPILLGKRLWSETRIALFQQSVDIRNANVIKRETEPRVSFGSQWLEGSVAELFKDNLSKYNLLFASDVPENSIDMLNNGQIPELNALKMHNSTVYVWNRPCYGVGGGKPHLRIENRYIPAGPTVVDEIANAAFWLGLMKGMPVEYADLPSKMAFADARFNFYNAARTGLDAQFKWFGQTVSAGKLLEEELLPLARKGLEHMKVDYHDIDRLLHIIESRIYTHKNGSSWITKNFGELLIGSTPNEASISITKNIFQNEEKGDPVHLWEDVDPAKRDMHKEFRRVDQIMTTDPFTVSEDEALDLVINVMDWKKVPFVPVEDSDTNVVGLITYKNLLRYHTSRQDEGDLSAKDIMTTEFETVEPECSTAEAVNIMAEKRVGCLLVVSEKKLLGIVTEGDILQVAKMTGRFG